MAKRKVKARTRHERAKRIGLALMGGYDAQLRKQGGGCAICGEPPKSRRLHVDHDHLTGDVRGLLCWTCNAVLGRARDNVARLQGAALYLKWGWQAGLAFRNLQIAALALGDDHATRL